MVRSVPRFASAMMAVTVTVGLVSLMACRSEAATPTPSATDAPAAGMPGAGMSPGTVMPGGVLESPAVLGSAGAISSRPYMDIGGFSGGFSFAAADSQFSGIQVSGMGKAVGKPDLAILNLGVESSRDTVEAARADAARAMEKIIAVLKARGVAERDRHRRYVPRTTPTGQRPGDP